MVLIAHLSELNQINQNWGKKMNPCRLSLPVALQMEGWGSFQPFNKSAHVRAFQCLQHTFFAQAFSEHHCTQNLLLSSLIVLMLKTLMYIPCGLLCFLVRNVPWCQLKDLRYLGTEAALFHILLSWYLICNERWFSYYPALIFPEIENTQLQSELIKGCFHDSDSPCFSFFFWIFLNIQFASSL